MVLSEQKELEWKRKHKAESDYLYKRILLQNIGAYVGPPPKQLENHPIVKLKGLPKHKGPKTIEPRPLWLENNLEGRLIEQEKIKMLNDSR